MIFFLTHNRTNYEIHYTYTITNFRVVDKQLLMTYSTINNMEILFQYRSPKHLAKNKEYVKKVDFVNIISRVIVSNILDAICDPTSLKTNEITEKLQNDLSQINELLNSSPETSRGKNIQLGVANALADILTTIAKSGSLAEIKNNVILYDYLLLISNIK